MKSLFHRGYFKEMFRQLRVVGIVAAAILMLTNITTFLTLLTDIGGMLTGYAMPDGNSLAVAPSVFVYITGLVFTFSVFGWMNKRSTSDFYHAIPVKRTQIYFSSILAVLLWMAIGLTAYSVVHACIYLVLGIPFNYMLFLCVFANMLIGAMEVVGAVSIACSISGTRFVNLFASAVILFIPRFMLTVLALFVREVGSESLVVSSISLLFNTNYNVFATPYALMIGEAVGSVSMRYANGWAMLYNIGYDIVLFVLGWVAFKKRRSESAGMPTTGRLFNGVIRTAIGLPFLLILAFLLLNGNVNLVGGVILVLLAFVFYCLYELISTKRAKKMLKAMPLFFICIGISLLYLVIPHLIDRIERSVSITESNIRGYSLVNDESSFLLDALFNNGRTPSYSSIRESQIVFSDPESKKIIVDAYNLTNSKDALYGNREYATVRIYRKFGRSITRQLCFNASQSAKLRALRQSNDEYIAVKSMFPDGKNYYSIAGLTTKESEPIGDLFRSEYESLNDVKKMEVWDGDVYGGDMTVFGCKGTRNYKESYSFSALTPKSYALYLRTMNEKNGAKSKEMLKEIIDWMESGKEDRPYFRVLINGETEVDIDMWMLSYMSYEDNGEKTPSQTDPEVYEILKIIADAPLTDDIDNNTNLLINDDSVFVTQNQTFIYLNEEQHKKIEELYLNSYYFRDHPYFDDMDPDY